MEIFIIFYILSLISAIFNGVSSKNTYDILSYGAVGDGKTDDTLAFVKTWNATCNDSDTPTMIIPDGKTFLVHQVTLAGPCKSTNVNFQLSGKIIAPAPIAWNGRDSGRWLAFRQVDGLIIAGTSNGLLDGSGKAWWDISCKHNPGKAGCNHLAPTILGFENCNNINMRGIRTVQSGGVHIRFHSCEQVELDSLNLQSPGDSPNTDGIHISHSKSFFINNSIIGTGDDCISIVDRSYNINITYIDCGPGHGISIGSLGQKGEEVDVNNITVSHINFHNTTNGARIKTWTVGRGQVQNVQFSDIIFKEVQNPIIIDQHYTESGNTPSPPSNVGVHINGVQYLGLNGTSKTQAAINLNCSENVACTNIRLENIELKSATPGEEVKSSCNNAFGSAQGVVEPSSCLRQQGF
uniref:Polygalacturonase n=1 Tax=Manihot esculenta TaxID=3983 RepID=A0A2C9V075_MANES